MAFPVPVPLVILVAEAPVETPVETPVEASPVVDFPIEAGFLLPWTGPVETLLVPSMFASTSSPVSSGLRVLLLAIVEREK